MNNRELLSAISELLDQKLDEKLDQKLDQKFKSELSPIRKDISELKSDVQDLKTDVQNLKSGMSRLEGRVTHIELHLENVTDKNIAILVENYVPAAKRFEKVSAQIESMQTDIMLLKKVAADHALALQSRS